jgi:hypothetical protein
MHTLISNATISCAILVFTCAVLTPQLTNAQSITQSNAATLLHYMRVLTTFANSCDAAVLAHDNATTQKCLYVLNAVFDALRPVMDQQHDNISKVVVGP